jgi:hypothetical protein
MRSRKAQQDGTWRAGRRRLIGLALPSGPRGVGRGRADEPPAACRCALARKRRDARPRRSGWPWSSSQRWRRAVNAAIAFVSARPAETPRQLAALPAPALPGYQPLLQRVRGSAPHNPGAPQSLSGRRMWEGRRPPLRRGPRQGARGGAASRRRGRWLAAVPRFGRA